MLLSGIKANEFTSMALKPTSEPSKYMDQLAVALLKVRISSSANETPPTVPLPEELTYNVLSVTGINVAVGGTTVFVSVNVFVGAKVGMTVTVFAGILVEVRVIVGKTGVLVLVNVGVAVYVGVFVDVVPMACWKG